MPRVRVSVPDSPQMPSRPRACSLSVATTPLTGRHTKTLLEPDRKRPLVGVAQQGGDPADRIAWVEQVAHSKITPYFFNDARETGTGRIKLALQGAHRQIQLTRHQFD